MTNLTLLTPLSPIPVALAVAATLNPTLALPNAAPPTPPVAAVKNPNSARPLASLPKPDLFSGIHSSGISIGLLDSY